MELCWVGMNIGLPVTIPRPGQMEDSNCVARSISTTGCGQCDLPQMDRRRCIPYCYEQGRSMAIPAYELEYRPGRLIE